MCLGIPGRVVEMVPGFGDQLALVEVEGVARRVNIGLLDEAPAPGQWVLIHMGFAVELTDPDGRGAGDVRPRADGPRRGTTGRGASGDA